jgi:hypothetical protein
MRGARADSGSGQTAPGIARLLGFTATPVFALMALWTGFSGWPADMLCMPTQGTSPFNDMAVMYGLMALFHAAPWLRLVQRG